MFQAGDRGSLISNTKYWMSCTVQYRGGITPDQRDGVDRFGASWGAVTRLMSHKVDQGVVGSVGGERRGLSTDK
jgi:hypothetical protein